MGTRWYYRCGRETMGPISSAELVQKVRDEEIRPDTRVKKGTVGRWVRARAIRGLFTSMPLPTPANEPENRLDPVDPRPADTCSPAADVIADIQASDQPKPFSSLGLRLMVAVTATAVILLVFVAGYWSKELIHRLIASNPPPATGPAARSADAAGEDGTEETPSRARDDPRPAPSDPTLPGIDPLSTGRSVEDSSLASAVEAREPSWSLNPAFRQRAAGTMRGPAQRNPRWEGLDVPVEPAHGPRTDGPTVGARGAAETREPSDERLIAMYTSYQQRKVLFVELRADNNDVRDLEIELAKLTGFVRQLALDAQNLIDVAKVLKMQAQAQERAYGVTDPQTIRKLGVCQMQYSVNLDRAISLNKEVFKTREDLDVIRRRFDQGARVAEQVTRSWLAWSDPFGRSDPAAYQRVANTVSAWIDEDPDFPLFYLARGFACAHLSQYETALKDINKMASLSPCLENLAILARGYVQSKQGNIKQATDEFTKADQLRPKDAMVYVFRGHSLVVQGRFSDAERDFRQAINFDATSAMAHDALAFLLAARAHSSLIKQKEAVEHAETACKLTQWGDWICLDTLAMAFAAAGNFNSAIDETKHALHLAPKECRAALQKKMVLYQDRKPYRID